MAEHFGSLALPVGEFLALEHGTEYAGYAIQRDETSSPPPDAQVYLSKYCQSFTIHLHHLQQLRTNIDTVVCVCSRLLLASSSLKIGISVAENHTLVVKSASFLLLARKFEPYCVCLSAASHTA